MRVAFVYGGQGSQVAGMGADFYEEYPLVKEIYDNVKLDIDVKELSFNGDLETISDTEITQPLLVTFNTAVTNLLKKEGIEPVITAGLSIGEYSALEAADVYSASDIIEISRLRGVAMQKATEGLDTTMFAILKAPYEEIVKACEKFSKPEEDRYIEVSNRNCPGQYVIAGDSRLAKECADYLKENFKARAIELNVSGAFHTTYMEPAGEELREFLKKFDSNTPNIPVVTNVTGKVIEDNVDLIENLVTQVKKTVNFEDTLKTVMENCDVIIEIGHNKTIAGFAKKIDRKFKVLEVNNVSSFKEAIEFLEGVK